MYDYEQLSMFLKFVKAINSVTDDLIVSGSLSMYIGTGELHRPVSDIDIILFNGFPLDQRIENIGQVLGEEYIKSSYQKYGGEGEYRLRVYRRVLSKGREYKNYFTMDVKNRKELHEVKDNLRILRLEALLCNKLASILTRDGEKRYIKIKDFYDLYFLLDLKDYDQDLVIYLLCKILARYGITNIFDTFMFKEESDRVYYKVFEDAKASKGLNEPVVLLRARDFLIQKGEEINKRLMKV